MGDFLNKLGGFAFSHKWQIITGWLLILAVVGGIAAKQYEPMSNAISIPGTEASEALDTFEELFPEAGNGSARVVFATEGDKSVESYEQTINKLNQNLADIDGVSQVVSPFVNPLAVSEDGQIAYAQIQLDEAMGEISEKTTDKIASAVDNSRTSGLQVEIGGDAINRVPGEIIGWGELLGVAIALFVLIITLKSLLSAGVPILIALVTVGIGAAGLFSLSRVVDITATTPVLAVMLGLAVGIDYSLFIINKYKHLLLSGYNYKKAAAKAVATAGSAVVFAAATVVIALAALSVVNIPFMTTMGLAGASTVALAAIVAVTLLPALLGLAGNKIFMGKTKKSIAAAQKRGVQDEHTVERSSVWYKWGRVLTKRPVLVLVVAIAVVGTMAWPSKSLELGLPTDEFAAKSSTERKAYDLLAKGFGDGFNGPLLVVAENVPKVSSEDKDKIRTQIEEQFAQQMAVAENQQRQSFEALASQATTPEQMMALQQQQATMQAMAAEQQQQAEAAMEEQIARYTEMYELNKVAEGIADVDGVQESTPAMVTSEGDAGVIQVIPSSSPSSEATASLIENLRDPKTQSDISSQITMGVTGSSALQIDVNDKLASALPIYLAVVVGLSLVLLIIAFRSILIPIKATLGFLLSVFAMFGALVAVFQWGWFGITDAPGPIVSFIPIISIGVLFGLAMDYEFFLVSSMHEEFRNSKSKNAKKAISDGFGLGSKVVTAAAVIMVAVFASFITNGDATIRAVGFGLAVGIFVDAFIVRMTIVPAVMTLLGKSAWWIPKWLDRRLPHVSIDGDN